MHLAPALLCVLLLHACVSASVLCFSGYPVVGCSWVFPPATVAVSPCFRLASLTSLYAFQSGWPAVVDPMPLLFCAVGWHVLRATPAHTLTSAGLLCIDWFRLD